jgi:hypothetical protein
MNMVWAFPSPGIIIGLSKFAVDGWPKGMAGEGDNGSRLLWFCRDQAEYYFIWFNSLKMDRSSLKQGMKIGRRIVGIFDWVGILQIS